MHVIKKPPNKHIYNEAEELNIIIFCMISTANKFYIIRIKKFNVNFQFFLVI